MQIDISEIVSCENREVTEKVHIEQDTFVSRLGEFPITKSAPFDLRIANREGSELLLSGETDLTVSIPVQQMSYGSSDGHPHCHRQEAPHGRNGSCG